MAVTEVKETWNGRTGSIDDSGVRTYTRVFRVRTNSTLDGPATILATNAFLLSIGLPILPGLLLPYADANGVFDIGALCRKVTPSQDPEDPNTWTITCEFSSAPLNIEQRNLSGDPGNNPLTSPTVNQPLNRPPVYKWHFNRYTKPIDTDILGNTILNSAGQKFVPAVEVDDSRPVLTVTRNELYLDPATVIAYQDAVNSDFFIGFLPETCKLTLEAESQYEDGLYYWRVTYVFEFRSIVIYPDPSSVSGGKLSASGWDKLLLNHGSKYLDSGGKLKTLVDAQGIPVNDFLLDAFGHVLTGAAVPTYKVYRVYPRQPFSVLGIPPVI